MLVPFRRRRVRKCLHMLTVHPREGQTVVIALSIIVFNVVQLLRCGRPFTSFLFPFFEFEPWMLNARTGVKRSSIIYFLFTLCCPSWERLWGFCDTTGALSCRGCDSTREWSRFVWMSISGFRPACLSATLFATSLGWPSPWLARLFVRVHLMSPVHLSVCRNCVEYGHAGWHFGTLLQDTVAIFHTSAP